MKKNTVHIIMMAAAFIATFVFDINVIYIILFAALIGLIQGVWRQNRGVWQ